MYISLVSVPVVRIVLNCDPFLIGLAVLHGEPPVHQRNKDNQQKLRGDAAPHASAICWILFLHEGARGIDAADSSKKHLDAAAHRSSRSTADVIGLEGDDGR